MKKIIKWFLTGVEAIILFILVGAVTTAITKHIHSYVLIEQFKKQGVLDDVNSTTLLKLYPIASEEEQQTCFITSSNVYPGNTGDILISLTSEIVTPIVHDFVSFFAGGHAALVLGDYSDDLGYANVHQTLESTGLVEGVKDAFIFSKNLYWAELPIYKEVIGLRVKMTEEERTSILVDAMAMEHEPYNYAFIWNTKNKSYCSDIISKIFANIGRNLNKDGFTTSVYDLLVTKDTYISYYHYIDSEGIKHVYYLD